MGKLKLNILDSHKGVDCSRFLLYCALIPHDKVFYPSNTLYASKRMHMGSIFDLRRGTCVGMILKFRIIFFCGGIWLDYLHQLLNTFKTISRMMDFPRGPKSTIKSPLLQVLGTCLQTQFYPLCPPTPPAK